MTKIAAIEFNNTFFFKFLKFGLVGFSGLIVDFSITYFFKEKLKVHKYLASSLGFIVATGTNYTLNRFWTFNSHNPDTVIQFGKFFMVSLVGLALSNALIYLLNDRLKWNFYYAKGCAILLVSLWNFFANYLYTFTG
ncbi:GtrA family protein [Pedobacter metabolipauper]|uniref:Putative flippase GtrA n=1 Tax=Pedobacter metabolipauper TaxID=425513 RepID=A0A4R6SS75_9SPHI|nr:GtrA family protein [Pedobacter metabolipauper]TDQ07084.1 putative flippase GtrA [Pedobacter metabolipauper]